VRSAADETVPGWTWDPIEEDFVRGIEELRAFVAREGHARVHYGFRTASDFRLGEWVASRRAAHGSGTLSLERVAALAAIPGWTWDPYRENFQRGLDELRAFVAREGHARVPQTHTTASGFHLGSWVSARRSEHGAGALSAERVTALEAIPGWTWDPIDENFRRGIEELRGFVAREGHARVPRTHVTSSGFRLAEWVANRRAQQGNGVLSPERVAALEGIDGWTWDPFDEDFKRGLDELRAFAATEGHARVPDKYRSASGFRLGGWVAGRRSARNKGALPPERVAMLEAIPGWIWDARGDRFQRGLDALRSFIAREGHARVPQKYTTRDSFPLGTWVNARRAQHDRGVLSPDRVTTLEALPGWTWDPLEDLFQRGLGELRSFVAREGHARVPDGYTAPTGSALGTWVGNRRAQRRSGVLSVDHVAMLEAIPGWTWRINAAFEEKDD